MSRQNKAAKKKVLAAQFTALHLKGEKGPSRTEPKHGKKNVQWKKNNAKAS